MCLSNFKKQRFLQWWILSISLSSTRSGLISPIFDFSHPLWTCSLTLSEMWSKSMSSACVFYDISEELSQLHMICKFPFFTSVSLWLLPFWGLYYSCSLLCLHFADFWRGLESDCCIPDSFLVWKLTHQVFFSCLSFLFLWSSSLQWIIPAREHYWELGS